MVEYELDGNAPIGFPRAYINGRQVYAGEYVMSPNSDYFGFLRFGAEGSRAYIAVYSDGSEDPCTELLMWDGSSMTVAATIPDCLFAYEYPSESSATPVISGIALSKIKTDRIEYTTRFEFVQMWDETGAYYVAADGCITRDDSTRQFRPVIPDAVMLKYALTVPADSGDRPADTGCESEAVPHALCLQHAYDALLLQQHYGRKLSDRSSGPV